MFPLEEYFTSAQGQKQHSRACVNHVHWSAPKAWMWMPILNKKREVQTIVPRWKVERKWNIGIPTSTPTHFFWGGGGGAVSTFPKDGYTQGLYTTNSKPQTKCPMLGPWIDFSHKEFRLDSENRKPFCQDHPGYQVLCQIHWNKLYFQSRRVHFLCTNSGPPVSSYPWERKLKSPAQGYWFSSLICPIMLIRLSSPNTYPISGPSCTVGSSRKPLNVLCAKSIIRTSTLGWKETDSVLPTSCNLSARERSTCFRRISALRSRYVSHRVSFPS